MGNARTAWTTSGTRSVMSARFRVNARTSPSSRCTWMRAPSSFHSTVAGWIRSSASVRSVAVCASIGWVGRSTVSRNRASPSPPPDMASAATSPRSPPTIRARRTSDAGTPAALATASTMILSSAPCRSSPERRPSRNRRSGSVVRENSSAISRRRTACEPFPVAVAIRPRAACTSRSSSAGGGDAGGGRSRSEAQPIPTVPCGRTPER